MRMRPLQLAGSSRPCPAAPTSRVLPLCHALLPPPNTRAQFLTTFPTFPDRQYLTLLPTAPTSPEFALGFCPAAHLDPSTFQENPALRRHLQACLRRHAHADPSVAAQAAAFDPERNRTPQ